MSEFLGQDDWIREFVPTRKDTFDTYIKRAIKFPDYLHFVMKQVSQEEVELVARAFDIIKSPHSQGDRYVVQVVRDLVFLVYSEEWS